MNGKQAKKFRKLEREKMKHEEEPQPKKPRRLNWAIITIILLSIVSLAAYGISSSLKDDNTLHEDKPFTIQTNHKSIDDEEITPETWRSLNLEMRKADGSIAKIDLLRPLWWIDESKAKLGGTISLSMPEMGIDGDAKVLKIGPCDVYSKDNPPGTQIVTGKFAHENAEVLDLYFNNNPEKPLGVTPNHPLWSATQGNWVEAGQLEVGEFVKTKDGIAQLTMRTKRPGRHTVYNIEVHKDNTYYVSNLNILAHNSCAKVPQPGQGKGWRKMKGNQGWKDTDGHIWKKDMKHKDHWDISNRKGKKIREIDFEGNEIWPNGPKNRNKRP